jgi:hypothetical protein
MQEASKPMAEPPQIPPRPGFRASRRSYVEYDWLVLRRAWSDTWDFTKTQGLLAGTIAAVFGSTIYWRIERDVNVVPILVGTFAGLGVLTFLWFILQLALAPWRLHRESLKVFEDLKQHYEDQFQAYLAARKDLERKHASNITHIEPSLAAIQRQLGTELRDILRKIEMVKATSPPSYSFTFQLPTARFGDYEKRLAEMPELYTVIARAYTAAHRVNSVLDNRRGQLRAPQTLRVTPTERLDDTYEAVGAALDAMEETRGEVFETSLDRAAGRVLENFVQAEEERSESTD